MSFASIRDRIQQMSVPSHTSQLVDELLKLEEDFAILCRQVASLGPGNMPNARFLHSQEFKDMLKSRDIKT